MSVLRVFAYNVGFGDAILVEVPDRASGKESTRHILIDVGNVLTAVDAEVFRPVAEDILGRLGGKPVDLYVMSHEHLDHVRGMLTIDRMGLTIPVDYAWLTASANPRYGDTYPRAQRRKRLLIEEYRRVAALAEARGLTASASVRAFVENNDPNRTADCVAFLGRMARKKRSWVHRGLHIRPGIHHPFREATLRIWAPEADTSTYYGRYRPLTATGSGGRFPRRPDGVDLPAYRALTQQLRAGLGTSMLAIDKAANNTSVVFSLEWRGWRLLFPGDAEERSWQVMTARRRLPDVHLLKVGHHGSHNGTPPPEILDALLPVDPPDGRRRVALLSTWPDTYPGVPDEATLARLRHRATVISTRSKPLGEPVVVSFDG